MRFERQHQTPEQILADTVETALGNTDTPELRPETRLEIVKGVLRVGWEKYRTVSAASSDRTRSGRSSSPPTEQKP